MGSTKDTKLDMEYSNMYQKDDKNNQSYKEQETFGLVPPKGKEAELSSSDMDLKNEAPEVSTTWGSQFEFILACIGYSVGLGSIWRFPYLCMQNGGGAFIIPFCVSLFLCGMPLYLLELTIAQFSGLRPFHVWNICPLFKGMGYAMGIACVIVSIYYNVVICWALYFFVKSFAKTLPWSSCGNWWNTPLCHIFNFETSSSNITSLNSTDSLIYNVNSAYKNSSVKELKYDQLYSEARAYANVSGNGSIPWKSPAEEFWQHEVLEITSGIHDVGGMNWELFGCFMMAWVIVFLCLSKGVKSLGKVVYVTATAPYVLLTILLIRGITLPGAMDGIMFYILPDWSKLLEFKVWAEACLQVFYALGPAWGSVLTIASYSRFNNNCVRDAIIVPTVTAITALYGGFILFAIIGFMAHSTKRPVEDFVTSGPGLAFIAYPEAIAQLPFSPLWGVLFFLMILTVGLDSQFGSMEFLTCSFVEMLPKRLQKHRIIFTAIVCFTEAAIGVIFVTRGGMYIFQIIDWYVATFAIMFIAIMECVIVAWFYGHERIYYDIELMTGKRPNIFWKICWCFITPGIILMLVIHSAISLQEPTYGDYVYPRWAITFGWFISMVSIIPFPIMFVKALMEQKGTLLQRVKKSLQPNSVFRPSDLESRNMYKYVPNTRTLWGFGAKKKTLL